MQAKQISGCYKMLGSGRGERVETLFLIHKFLKIMFLKWQTPLWKFPESIRLGKSAAKKNYLPLLAAPGHSMMEKPKHLMEHILHLRLQSSRKKKKGKIL